MLHLNYVHEFLCLWFRWNNNLYSYIFYLTWSSCLSGNSQCFTTTYNCTGSSRKFESEEECCLGNGVSHDNGSGCQICYGMLDIEGIHILYRPVARGGSGGSIEPPFIALPCTRVRIYLVPSASARVSKP